MSIIHEDVILVLLRQSAAQRNKLKNAAELRNMIVSPEAVPSKRDNKNHQNNEYYIAYHNPQHRIDMKGLV